MSDAREDVSEPVPMGGPDVGHTVLLSTTVLSLHVPVGQPWPTGQVRETRFR